MLRAVARRPVDYLGFLPGRLLGGVDGLEGVLTGVGDERRADHARRVHIISVDKNLVSPAPAVASHGPDPAVCHPRRPNRSALSDYAPLMQRRTGTANAGRRLQHRAADLEHLGDAPDAADVAEI